MQTEIQINKLLDRIENQLLNKHLDEEPYKHHPIKNECEFNNIICETPKS